MIENFEKCIFLLKLLAERESIQKLVESVHFRIRVLFFFPKGWAEALSVFVRDDVWQGGCGGAAYWEGDAEGGPVIIFMSSTL